MPIKLNSGKGSYMRPHPNSSAVEGPRRAFPRRKPARIHQIVLDIRRLCWRSEPKKLAVCSLHFGFQPGIGHFARGENLYLASLQAVVAGHRIRIEFVAVRDNAPVGVEKELLRILRHLSGRKAVAARPVPRPLEAPLQRTHHAVVVHRREPVLPVIHPLCVAGRHVEPTSLTSTSIT